MSRFNTVQAKLIDAAHALFGTASNPVRIDPTGATQQPVVLQADLQAGVNKRQTVTITAANTDQTVALPDAAKGLILHPHADTEILFGLGGSGADLGAAADANGWLNGNVLRALNHAEGAQPEARLLPATTGRTLRLRCATAGKQILVEVY